MNLEQLSSENINDLNFLNTLIFQDEEHFPESYLQYLIKNKIGIIGYVDGEPVGYIIYPFFKNDLKGGLKFEVMTLGSIGVVEEFRHQGIGTHLINTVKQLYPKYDLYLHVRVSNSNAIAAYTKSGFVKINTLPEYYSNNKENAYYMRFSNYTIVPITPTDVFPKRPTEIPHTLTGVKALFKGVMIGYLITESNNGVTTIADLHVDPKFDNLGYGVTSQLIYEVSSIADFKNIGVYLPTTDSEKKKLFDFMGFTLNKMVKDDQNADLEYYTFNPPPLEAIINDVESASVTAPTVIE